MYAQAGRDPSLFDKHRSERGTIQHGAKLRTTDYVGAVLQDLSQGQAAAMVAVSGRGDIAPGTIVYMSASWPVAVITCRTSKDGSVEIRAEGMKVRLSRSLSFEEEELMMN
jgi:hypothetical protein